MGLVVRMRKHPEVVTIVIAYQVDHHLRAGISKSFIEIIPTT